MTYTITLTPEQARLLNLSLTKSGYINEVTGESNNDVLASLVNELNTILSK